MAKEELEQFEADFYKKAQKKVFQEMILDMNQNRQAYLQQIKNGLIGVMNAVSMIQKVVPTVIGSIQISLMRYSVLKLTPVVRIDVYGELGLLGDSLCSTEVVINWTAQGIKNLQEKAIQEIKKTKYKNKINEEQVKVLLMKSMDQIEYYFMESLRYERKMIEEIEEIRSIEKAKDFYVSAGGYMEKQVYIYTEREKVDIFYNLNKSNLIYRKYENLAYESKVFETMDLEGAVFSNCSFEDFTFRDCKLLDVTFEHCTFKKGVFSMSDMRGCMFKHCTFYKVEHKGDDCNSLSGNNGILYRPFTYQECEMKRMNYTQCNLSHGKVIVCNCKQVEVSQDSMIENSDFSKWMSC